MDAINASGANQGPGGADGDRGEVLSIMTLNINGLAPTVKNFELRHKSFRGFLDHWNLDIAAFQEVKLPAAKVTKELACVGGFQSFWATSTAKLGYSGVTTWCRVGPAVAAAPSSTASGPTSASEPSGREAELGTSAAGGAGSGAAGGGVAPWEAVADNLGGDEQPELDTEGRFVQTDHGAFVLLNVYVPNAGEHASGRPRLGHKLAFLRALRRRMDELTAEGRQVIAVGDFNVAMEPQDVHSVIDYSTAYSAEELMELRALAAAYPDVWRVLHPHTSKEGKQAGGPAVAAGGDAGGEIGASEGAAAAAGPAAADGDGAANATAREGAARSAEVAGSRAAGSGAAASGASTGAFTVWEERTNARAFNVGCRIDYFFISPALLPFVESCEILTAAQIPPKWSDHAALLLRLRVRRQPVQAAGRPMTAGAEAGADAGEQRELPRLLLPPPPAAPCAMWLAMEGRFVDRNQRSIKDMFFGSKSKKQPAQPQAGVGKEATPPPPAAGSKRSAPEPPADAAGRGEAPARKPPVAVNCDERRSCKRQAVGPQEDQGPLPVAGAAAVAPGAVAGHEARTGQKDGLGSPAQQAADVEGAALVAGEGRAEAPSGADCGDSGNGSGGGGRGGDGGEGASNVSGGSLPRMVAGKGAAGRSGRGRGAAGKPGGRTGSGGRGGGGEPVKGRGIQSFFKSGTS